LTEPIYCITSPVVKTGMILHPETSKFYFSFFFILTGHDLGEYIL